MTGKKDLDVVSTLRKLIRDELRGVYTASACIVEEVDSAERRVTVSLKSDKNVFVDNVPISSVFATDGAGVVTPVQRDDEGVLLHLREPFDQQLQESGHIEPTGNRRFTLEDAIFLPMLWLDDMDVPDHDEGELLIAVQDDGSVLRMAPDGSVCIEHGSGTVIEVTESGTIKLGTPGETAPVLTTNAELTDSEGGSVTIDDSGSTDTEAS